MPSLNPRNRRSSQTRPLAQRVSAKAARPRQTAPKSQSRKVAKLVLLAGGNLKSRRATATPPCRCLHRGHAGGWKRDVGRRLDALIVRTVPEVPQGSQVELGLLWHRGRGWFLNFHCFTNTSKVAFFRGTSLRPLPPGESKHKDVRYLDIHEDGQLDEELVASWIRQASELPGWVRSAGQRQPRRRL